MHPPNSANGTYITSACNAISNENNQSQDMIDSNKPLHRPFDAVPSEIITIILFHLGNKVRPRPLYDFKGLPSLPSRRDLCSCLYVSKLFYSLSKLLLWRDFHTTTHRLLVPSETMRQNRDLVRTLTTTFNIALLRAEIDNILLFPHVTELTITDVNILYTFHHGKLDNIFACLIRQHRETLESLKVYNICIPDRDRWYLLRTQSNKEVVSSMHLFKRIKRLEIENVDTRGYEKLRAIGDFWNLSSLQELHLNSVTLALYPDGVTGNTVATSIDPHIQQETSQSSEPCRLRHLTIVQLRGDPETLDRLVLMLGHCPDLSSVIWHSIPDKYYLWPHTFSRIASGLADRTIQWPSLRKLDLRCEYLSDDEITSGVLNAFTGGLEDLAIRAGIFGNQALQVLQDKHSGTLKRLDLYGSSATSATIHSILCTCSRLVFIRAHRLLFIPSRTIPDDRPWICKDLQEWHVVIETERISQDIVDPSGENQKNLEEVTRKIFDRLSTLSRISILALGLDRSLGGCRLSNGTKLDRPCRRRRWYSPPLLQLRLDWGLDQLKTLKDLVLLSSNKDGQRLGGDERRWLESTFPRLRIQV